MVSVHLIFHSPLCARLWDGFTRCKMKVSQTTNEEDQSMKPEIQTNSVDGNHSACLEGEMTTNPTGSHAFRSLPKQKDCVYCIGAVSETSWQVLCISGSLFS